MYDNCFHDKHKTQGQFEVKRHRNKEGTRIDLLEEKMKKKMTSATISDKKNRKQCIIYYTLRRIFIFIPHFRHRRWTHILHTHAVHNTNTFPRCGISCSSSFYVFLAFLRATLVHSHIHTLGKLTGWHTAVLNISGSFLLGAVYAVPTIDTTKNSTTNTKITSQYPSWINLIRDPWGRIQQGITPRTKLMWGVGFCGRYAVYWVNSTLSLSSNVARAVLDFHDRLIRSCLCCCRRSSFIVPRSFLYSVIPPLVPFRMMW